MQLMVQNNCVGLQVKYTGIKVRQKLFQELDEKRKNMMAYGLCIYSPLAEKTTA